KGASAGRSDHQAEIQKARALLKLPEAKSAKAQESPKGIPDLKSVASALPAGVRLFIRQDDPGNSVASKLPVVEVVPMKPEDWKPLAFPTKGKEIDAEVVKNWLVWLYPAGIRAADEMKRFQKFSGTLKLEPAGSDEKFRYALLRGQIQLVKGSDSES